MDAGLGDLLGVGLPALLLGMLVLGFMVQRELGPFAGLEKTGKWMLGAALGMGVLAFSLKMLVAIAVAKMPGGTVAPLVGASASRIAQSGDGAGGQFAAPPARPTRYVWEALPEFAPAPSDNPTTAAKVALGERLFNDKALSADGSVSCASCHDLYARAGADGRATAKGIAGLTGARNTPTVWNAAFQSVLFWDGRAPSLEEQAKGPILNPKEMGMVSARALEERLGANPDYRRAFSRAFGGNGPPDFEQVAKAIAAYERTLITADSAYDRFVRGDRSALSPAQLRGMALFESTGCVMCHRGANFSDASTLGGTNPFRLFPANATPFERRYDLLSGPRGPAVFRVPSLRNVALTGPWLHNGSVKELAEVVRIMASAQLGRSGAGGAWLEDSGTLGRTDRSAISEKEVADLVAFLEALSSERLLQAWTCGPTRQACG